jgi:hypothetical protein
MSIGEALAQARGEAGLTVTQVSHRTHIRETIIADIEGNDYSACGGDFYARGYIRLIARAVGADPEPLIREFDTTQLSPQTITDDMTRPTAPTEMHGRRRLNWTAALGLVLLVVVGLATYYSVTGSDQAISNTSPAGAHPVTHHRAGQSRQATPAPKPSTPGAVPAHKLTPDSAAAFGPYGTGQGDHSDLAHLAIDSNPATAWRTDWYTTAHFGDLYPGTGLLVDMGQLVTVTAAQITLGRAHGTRFQLRVGTARALADLPPVAHVANASGVVRLRLTTPARGRYVLIWFTSLPPNPAGTFQASVSNLRLDGHA